MGGGGDAEELVDRWRLRHRVPGRHRARKEEQAHKHDHGYLHPIQLHRHHLAPRKMGMATSNY